MGATTSYHPVGNKNRSKTGGRSGNNHINLRHVRPEFLEDHPGEMYARKLDLESLVHGKFRNGDPDGESLILRRHVKPQRMSSPKERIYKKKKNGSTLGNKKEKKRERQRQR